MFGSSMFQMFEEDPFFREHNRRVQQMNAQMGRMMGGWFSADPFMPAIGYGSPDSPLAIEDTSHLGHRRDQQRHRHGGRHRDLAQHDMFGGHGGDIFSQMMAGMHQMQHPDPMLTHQQALIQAHQAQHAQRALQARQAAMPAQQTLQALQAQQAQRSRQALQAQLVPSLQGYTERMQADPNSAFYSESRVMSYSSNGSGRPQVYEASSSTRQVPGGVRETRKTVRDSEAGVEKMSVGRHIKDRAHVIERERNANTGDQEENQDFINLDESEAEAFGEEFRHHTQQYRSRAGPERVARLNQGLLGDGRSPRKEAHYIPSAVEGQPSKHFIDKNSSHKQHNAEIDERAKARERRREKRVKINEKPKEI